MPGTVLYCQRLCRLAPCPPSLSASLPFPAHGPAGPSRRRATCFLSPPSPAPGPPEYLYPTVGGEKKVLIRYYSGIITMRISGVAATEPPRSRRWLTRESAALSVLPPQRACHGLRAKRLREKQILGERQPTRTGRGRLRLSCRGSQGEVQGVRRQRSAVRRGCFSAVAHAGADPAEQGEVGRLGEGGTWCMGERSRLRGG